MTRDAKRIEVPPHLRWSWRPFHRFIRQGFSFEVDPAFPEPLPAWHCPNCSGEQEEEEDLVPAQSGDAVIYPERTTWSRQQTRTVAKSKRRVRSRCRDCLEALSPSNTYKEAWRSGRCAWCFTFYHPQAPSSRNGRDTPFRMFRAWDLAFAYNRFRSHANYQRFVADRYTDRGIWPPWLKPWPAIVPTPEKPDIFPWPAINYAYDPVRELRRTWLRDPKVFIGPFANRKRRGRSQPDVVLAMHPIRRELPGGGVWLRKNCEIVPWRYWRVPFPHPAPSPTILSPKFDRAWLDPPGQGLPPRLVGPPAVPLEDRWKRQRSHRGDVDIFKEPDGIKPEKILGSEFASLDDPWRNDKASPTEKDDSDDAHAWLLEEEQGPEDETLADFSTERLRGDAKSARRRMAAKLKRFLLSPDAPYGKVGMFGMLLLPHLRRDVHPVHNAKLEYNRVTAAGGGQDAWERFRDAYLRFSPSVCTFTYEGDRASRSRAAKPSRVKRAPFPFLDCRDRSARWARYGSIPDHLSSHPRGADLICEFPSIRIATSPLTRAAALSSKVTSKTGPRPRLS